MDKFNPIHKHFIVSTMLDLEKARLIKRPDITTSALTLRAKKFLLNMVQAIGMKPVTSPQAVYVADPGNEGLTGSINLATSHIAFHLWDETGLLQADVYSCKDFDERIVLEQIELAFGPALRQYSTTFDRSVPTAEQLANQ